MGSKFKTTKEFDDFCKSVERDSLLFDVNKIVEEAKVKEEDSKYDMPDPIKIIDNDVSFEDKEKRIPFIIELIDVETTKTIIKYESLISYSNFSETCGYDDKEICIQEKEEFVNDIIKDFNFDNTNLDDFNLYLAKLKFVPKEKRKGKEDWKYIPGYFYCLITDGELLVLSDAWNLADASEIVSLANIHDLKFDLLDWGNVYQEAKKYMLETGYICSILDK